MKQIRTTFIILILVITTAALEVTNKANTMQYLSKRDKVTKVGTIFHYTGALRYSNLLIGEEIKEGLGYTGYFFASGRKIHGDIMAGVAATRACKQYNNDFKTSETFSWKYYIAGVGSYAFGFGSLTALMRTDLPREVGISLFITGVTACEILTTIHVIKARRTTQRLLSQAESQPRKVSWGIFPLITPKGGGVSLGISF